jgi:hypothetical protein
MTNLDIFLLVVSFFTMLARHFDRVKAKKRHDELLSRNCELGAQRDTALVKVRDLEMRLSKAGGVK